MNAFRLAGLGRLRRLQEDQAAAELARRRADRRAAYRRTLEAQDQLAGSVLGGPADPQTWRAAVAARAALSSAVTAAQATAQSAQAQERQAQGQWTAARRRNKAVEKLAERHREAERRADNRVEQQALDELATQRAARRTEER